MMRGRVEVREWWLVQMPADTLVQCSQTAYNGGVDRRCMRAGRNR